MKRLFNVTVIINAVELLKYNFDIKEETKSVFASVEYYRDTLMDGMTKDGILEEYVDLFGCADLNVLFDNYITVDADGVQYNFDEDCADEGQHRDSCFFRVPCSFDLEKYIKYMDQANAEDSGEDDEIAITVYRDTIGPNSHGDDNLGTLIIKKDMLMKYFKERILPSFKGDDKSVSDDGLLEEWLSEYTADDTNDLWDYITSQKSYYIDLYNKAYGKFFEQAKKDGSSNPEETANELFDESATAGEIVGCYLVYHGDDAYKDWMENLTFYTERSKEKQEEFPPIKKAQDEEVTRILARLCDNAAVEITSTPMLGIKKYAVTSYWCGEEGVTKIWLCSSEKEAIDKMRRLWEKSYNFALEDENFDKERTYHEDLEGRVAWDDELYRVFEVIQISDADDEEI